MISFVLFLKTRNPQLLTQLDESSSFTSTSLERKIIELKSILNITISASKSIIRRAPTLAGINIERVIKNRCVDMQKLLHCNSEQVRKFSINNISCVMYLTKSLKLNTLSNYLQSLPELSSAILHY